MNKELKAKIIKIINSGDLENGIKTLSLEEKTQILLSENILATSLCDSCLKRKIVLLNKDEFKKAAEENKDLTIELKRSYLTLVNMPDDLIMTLSEIDPLNRRALLQFLDNKKILEDYIANLNAFQVGDVTFPFLTSIPDEEIEKMILDPKNQDPEKLEYLINALKSDKYRIKYIEKLAKDEKIEQIKNINDDHIKEKYLHLFTPDKESIIMSFNSDELKIKYLKKYKHILSSSDKSDILLSLKDKSLIKKNITSFAKQKDLIEIATSLYTYDTEFFDNVLDSINGDLNIKKIFDNLDPYLLEEKLFERIINKVSSQTVLFSIFRKLPDEAMLKVLPRISEKNIEKYISETMGSNIHPKVFLYLKNDNLLFEALTHCTMKEKFSEELLPLFEKVSIKYGLNTDHLISIAKLTNCGILNQIENKHIKDAINLSDEDFKKYLKIISEKNQNIDIVKINTVLVSLLNKKFNLDYPEKVSVFANTMHDLSDKNYTNAINKIDEICSVINVEEEGITYEQLLKGLQEGNEEIITKYRNLTNKYLIEKRNQHIKLYMDEALYSCADVKVEKNGILKYFFNSMVTEDLIEKIIKGIERNPEYKHLNNPELLREIIEFKKGNIPYQSVSEKAKNNLKSLEDFCYYNYSNFDKEYFGYFKLKEMIPDVSLIHTPYKKNIELSIFEIISNIDVQRLKDKIFTNEELYDDMLKYIERYGMIGWNSCFEELSSFIDVDLNAETVASLISNYDLIAKETMEKRQDGKEVNFMNEMAFAECLSSKSSIYNYLLGDENSKLLARNPQPNSSPLGKTEILEKSIPLLKQMHERKTITVPPIDEDVTLEIGKEINLSVGATNDPINLTFGERTGACMRIGGAGETLFNFCLLNENGFHISFTDPDSKKLVSRVSGFRNGNTVFLNQLRYPIGKKYSNEDVIEACELISKKLIELTKNSEYPIENVVASPYYALEREKTQTLNITDPTNGLPTFYTDIGKEVVVIASSNNKELLPVKTNPNSAERYEPSRMKIKKVEGGKSIIETGRIEALDQLYSGKNIDEINVPEKENILYSYVGEDWYVIVQKDGSILKYIEENTNNRNKAIEEMNKYMSLAEREIKINNSSSNGNTFEMDNTEVLEVSHERSR